MKTKNIIVSLFAAVCCIVLVGCNKGHELKSPHTDASSLVVGTYEGVMTLDGGEITGDVVAVITRVENDSVQAVSVNFKSAAKSMDQTVLCNVAAAGDRFVIVPACSSKDAARNASITLEGEVLTISSTLNSKFAISAGSSAKRYIMTCTKK